MKKRIGNDIQFTWHIYRKSGDTQTPESFNGKDVEVKLISPLKQPVTIEDVTIATGVVTFTFRGKHQVTLGNYVAVLLENRGENGMATIDVVNAVTLVPHSYMEEDGDEGDVIEAESVELTSTITAGGGGGMVQQQADWAQTDDTAVDFIKHKPDVVSVGEDGVTINKQFLCLLREAEGKIQRIVLNTPEQGDAYVGVLDNLEDTNILIYPHGIFFEKGGVYGGYLKTDPTNHPGRLLLDNKVLAYIDDLASLVDGGAYNTQTKEIELKHGNTVLARIDARAFVKDGMVDSVVIENGYIVITFNTDAGKQNISLALTDIFNPANYYDKTAMDALLAGKQNTITDLPAIRSGAAAGATAVQPADLNPIEERLDNAEEALTESLPVESFVMDDYSIGTASIEGVNISSVADVPINQCRKPYGYPSNSITIDNTTYYKALRKLSGDEVVAEFEFEAKGNLLVYYGLYGAGSHYDYFLSFYFTSEDGTITNKSLGGISVFDVEEKAGKLILFIPKKGLLTIKATEDRDDGWTYPYTYYANIVRIDFTATPLIAVYDLKSDVQAIEQKIPAQASSSNQLADKDFVNSSIATATATYRGSYNLVSDLSLSVSATQQQIAEALATKMAALSITPDNNDYCFVQIPTADATPTEIARIDRYKYDGTAWAYEYSLNNSSFTAAQWAALNSGITSGLVTKLSALPTNSELTALLSGKANTSDLAEVATSGSYNDLSGKPTIPTVPSNVSAFNNDAGYLTATDVYTKAETYNKTEVNNLITTPNQQYVSVTATAQTTAVTDLLPTTGEANTIYRVGNWDGTQYNDSVFSEYAWNGSAYIKLSTKSQVGEVYDISANHADTKYSDLAAALGANGANIPQSLRKGGMSIKFVQTSDNKYVQYRLMSDTFSTTERNWQGVEGKPAFYSKNLVDGNGIAEEFYKKDLNLYRGFLYAVINSSGNWIITNGFIGCFIVHVTGKEKISVKKGTSNCIFAFLKSDTVNAGQSADFCNGETGRRTVSGNDLTEFDIPQDCNYIYCLLSTDGVVNYTPSVFKVDDVSYVDDIDNFKDYIDSLAKSTANTLEQKIVQEKTRAEGAESILTTNISKINTDLEPVLDATDNLDWVYKYQFVASDTPSAVLSSNIVLSQDGDSIEFKLDACSYQNFSSDNRGYAFTNNPNSTSKIAFGVTRERMALRADDGTWLIPASTILGGSVVGKMVKVSYENSSIKLYIDGVEKASYSGQKTVTISGFGNGSTYGYWDGSFSQLKINGQSVELKDIATLNNVVVTLLDSSFLSESEKETLYGNVYYPSMMMEKTANKVVVYKHLQNEQYIAYPLNKRYKAYTENQYPSFYDNWGIGQVYLTQFNGTQMTEVTTLFKVGEAELAISVPKSTDPTAYDYVGGSAHGFENIVSTNDHRNIIFLIDNQECQEDGVVALKACHSVEVIQKTQLCQAYSNTNPFAEATKHWLFYEGENLRISTSVNLLRNIDIKQAQFGMFCVYRHLDDDSNKVYLTNKGVKGDEVFNTYTLEDGWDDLTNHPENTGIRTKDHDCKKITEYGVCGLGFSMTIVDSTIKSSGGMFVTTNGSSYNKIYFDLTGQYSATADEVLSATQEWSIEGKFNQ